MSIVGPVDGAGVVGEDVLASEEADGVVRGVVVRCGEVDDAGWKDPGSHEWALTTEAAQQEERAGLHVDCKLWNNGESFTVACRGYIKSAQTRGIENRAPHLDGFERDTLYPRRIALCKVPKPDL